MDTDYSYWTSKKRRYYFNYDYKCANEPLKPTDLAIQIQTPINYAGNGANIYLDRHLIQCQN